MEHIVVRKSRFGKGVFADKDFTKDEKICVIKGNEEGLEVLQSMKRQNRNLLVDPMQIGSDRYLDMDEPYLYLNHSCNPNAVIRGAGELFAIKDIKKGEEVFYDYSTTMDEELDCKCGSKNCRYKISDFLTLPKELQEKYIKLGAIPDFIKNKIAEKPE